MELRAKRLKSKKDKERVAVAAALFFSNITRKNTEEGIYYFIYANL